MDSSKITHKLNPVLFITATKLAMVNNLKIDILYPECQLIYWNHYEYVEKRTYRSLKRAWTKRDHEKIKYYAEGIQKFERQLRLPISNFSDIIKENDLDIIRQNKEQCRNQ